ncbi:hypothetical protein JTE90_012437 [Oedothorax gibbosus]|uniref:Uncharacterized protein n=1 Tax=Oedothorax gibbosus TaxID=931172 RepID=A0AAV6TEI1_9ARAC|nr:hypothetical protein JTE90_012437 [Oedothorax gibbosus]
MCASHGVLNKPGGEMKYRPAEVGRIRDPRSLAGGAHRRPAAFHLWKWRSLSAHVGTRKMVNYARTDEARGNSGRSVAVLTCKSIVRSGSSGVRLIEPSSSWFLRSFPSG